ncbi:MAG: RNase adapter RapZ [Pseudomonadota bacterium]
MAKTPDTVPTARLDPRERSLVLVSGPSGAGRSTAMRHLEDFGYETIDNLPLSLVPRLLDGPPMEKAMALGVDVRNRDFSIDGLLDTLAELESHARIVPRLLYLDASADVLLRRYSETRRRHPLAPAETASEGIARELALLAPLKDRAEILIDSSELTPHELRRELERWFGQGPDAALAVTLHSFSFKRGPVRGLDMMFDCRFLQNPYWEEALRGRTGQDSDVQAYVSADPLYESFFHQVQNLALLLLPAYRKEGKTYLSVGFGCTGGQHRSVTLAEHLSKALAEQGWPVSIRHRELERLGLYDQAGGRQAPLGAKDAR